MSTLYEPIRMDSSRKVMLYNYHKRIFRGFSNSLTSYPAYSRKHARSGRHGRTLSVWQSRPISKRGTALVNIHQITGNHACVTAIVVTAYNLLTIAQTPNIKDIFSIWSRYADDSGMTGGNMSRLQQTCASHDKEQSVLTCQLTPQGRETLPNSKVPLRILKPSHTIQRFV